MTDSQNLSDPTDLNREPLLQGLDGPDMTEQEYAVQADKRRRIMSQLERREARMSGELDRLRELDPDTVSQMRKGHSDFATKMRDKIQKGEELDSEEQAYLRDYRNAGGQSKFWDEDIVPKDLGKIQTDRIDALNKRDEQMLMVGKEELARYTASINAIKRKIEGEAKAKNIQQPDMIDSDGMPIYLNYFGF